MSSETAQVSSLPLPPMQYINFYTDENVRRNRAPLPPRPIHDSYSMFGHTFNADDTIIRSLESQGFRRLYPMHFERRRELKKLNHSLLANFLDLLDLLVHCPDSPKRAEKVEDLSLLFIHIHHLLNEFRPHQARETLRVMMELQKRQRVETAIRFKKHLDKVQDILQNALQSLPDQNEIESNFKVPVEILEHMDCSSNDVSNSDGCYELDRIMCNVVDNMSAQSVPPPAWTTKPPKPRNQVWAEQVMSRHLINMTDNLIRDLQDKYEFARTVQDSYKHSKSYELGYLAAGVQELFKTMLEIYRTYSHLEDFKNGRYSVPEYVDAYQVVQGHYNDLREQKKLYYEALDKYKQRHEAREEFFAVLNHHCPANKKRFKKVPDAVLQDNREIIHNLKAYKVIYKCEDEGATRKAVRKVKWPGWRRQFSYYPGRESLLESMNKPPIKNVWLRNNTDFSHIDRIAF